MVHGLAAFKASNELISNLRRCLSDNNCSQIICDLEVPGNTSANQSQAAPPSNSFTASPFHVACRSFTSNPSTQVQVCAPSEDIEMDIDDPMGMDESEFQTSVRNISKNEEIITNPAPNQVSSSPPSDPPTFEAVATAVQQSLTSVRIFRANKIMSFVICNTGLIFVMNSVDNCSKNGRRIWTGWLEIRN